MALNVGLRVSFDNMYDWNGIRGKAGEIENTNVCITNDKYFWLNSQTGAVLVYLLSCGLFYDALNSIRFYSVELDVALVRTRLHGVVSRIHRHENPIS
jgi:hypothetical protein